MKANKQIENLFELMNIDTKARQDYFMLLLAQKKNPTLLDSSRNAQKIHNKLTSQINLNDIVSFIPGLVELYANKIENSSLGLENFYDELLITAHKSQDQELISKIEDLFETHVNSLEKSSLDSIENQAQQIDNDTFLNAELVAEYMGIEPGLEKVLFNKLRSFFDQAKFLGIQGKDLKKLQNSNTELSSLATELNNQQRLAYINNVAKLASDIEASDDPRFNNFGLRMLKIASYFSETKLANKIFDTLPNIFLQKDS